MNPAPLDVFGCPLGGISLIEASAGTGKTWNLCGLYLRLLLERGLQVQQILVVTFTNAATAELRERIRSRIVETLTRLRGALPAAADPFVDRLLETLRTHHALADTDMVLRLELALQTFDEAAIHTIHGFCQRALADTAFAAGLPTSLQLLADDTEMRMQVVHDFWRRHVASDTLAPALAAHLLRLGDSPPRYAQLLQRQLAKPLSELIWPAGIDTATVPDLSALMSVHAQARASWPAQRSAIVDTLTAALGSLNGTSYKAGSVSEAAAAWDSLLSTDDPMAGDPKAAKHELLRSSVLVRRTRKNQTTPAHPFFDLAEQWSTLRQAALVALALTRWRLLRQLLVDGPPALRRAKRERRVIAFDDMLHNVYERLVASPDLAGALRTRFPAALIDEFQDTDPLQFAIFKAVYGGSGAPLFLVGDPQQAIDSFRNADLHTYLQGRSEATVEYSLSDNQRSTQALLDGLNALFGANDRAFVLPGLEYRPVACGAKPRPLLRDDSAPRAALQLWQLPDASEGQPLTKPQAMQLAADACAGEIARLLESAQRGVTTLDDRPLAAGDIAVLVRSHAQGARMRLALAQRAVGSVELSQASVYASTEALDLATVLAAIVQPAREGLLRAALATELLGRDACAIEAMSADAAAGLAFMTRCIEARQTWLQQGIGPMLRQWMVREGVHARLLARPDGERRLTNLLHLCELLHQASQAEVAHADPEALLRWLHQRRAEAGSDEAAQLRLESDRDLVQIVTIHRSKGLEYPMVFCPFLFDGRPGHVPAGVEGLEYHDARGAPVIDLRSAEEIGDVDESLIKQQLGLERAAENLRLVYVALTRAVQRCHVVVGRYQTGRHGSTTESARALLNWLVTGQGHAPHEWLLKPPAVDLGQAWNAFAAKRAPQIGLAALPDPGAGVASPPPERDATLAALAPPRHIARGWRVGSYSSLTHGSRHEGAAVDHDLRAPDLASALADSSPAAAAAFMVQDNDILHFPRGPTAGECLHRVFERIDFTDPTGWPAAIDSALRGQPPGRGASAPAALHVMLRSMLEDVLHTALPGAGRLCDVPRLQRLVELEFNLPSNGLKAGRLAALLCEHGYPVPPLAFGTLDGYLRGFIDLVFEQAGRFHVLDWKSNHLGMTPADYGGASMARAMDAHGYHLQYLLYSVAVHRYLQQRVPDYCYEDHYAGVTYLFVRGVRPGWTDATGQPAGVYRHRPSRRAIEALSALLGGSAGKERR